MYTFFCFRKVFKVFYIKDAYELSIKKYKLLKCTPFVCKIVCVYIWEKNIRWWIHPQGYSITRTIYGVSFSRNNFCSKIYRSCIPLTSEYRHITGNVCNPAFYKIHRYFIECQPDRKTSSLHSDKPSSPTRTKRPPVQHILAQILCFSTPFWRKSPVPPWAEVCAHLGALRHAN